MRKNLFLYHLESVSQSMFWQYRTELPAIWKLMETSMYFQNCYASGNSTEFAFAGLSYGSISILDSYSDYRGFVDEPRVNGKGLFEILHDDFDYETIALSGRMEDYFGGDWEHMGCLPGMSQQYRCTLKNYECGLPDLRKSLETAANEQRPFALHSRVGVDIHHVSFDRFPEYADMGVDELQRFLFKTVDDLFALELGMLEDQGLVDNTLIIVYGDHGVSIYNRGATPARPRGVMITAEQSWVPLLIKNSSLGTGVTGAIASLDDLRATILGQLIPGENFLLPAVPFQGVDLAREHRPLAFSQNTRALQRVTNPLNLLKAYAVTDGHYRLLVESFSEAKDAGGMRMYIDNSDSGNVCDLLHFFDYDDTGAITGLHEPSLANVAGYRIFTTFNPRALVEMMKRYEILRKSLHRYVREKESYALAFPGSEAHLMPEESFQTPNALIERRLSSHANSQWSGKGMRWLIDQNRPLLLFGAAWTGSRIPYLLDFYGCEAAAYIDNSAEAMGFSFHGLEVLTPNAAKERFPNAIVLGTPRAKQTDKEIRNQSERLGLEYYHFVVDILGANYGPERDWRKLR